MTDQKMKINVVEDAEATGEVATVYDEWRAHSGRQQMPGILKCFSHRPDFLREVMSFSNTYWLDSHAYFLRVQGAEEKTVQAIAEGKLDEAGLTQAERVLLEYVTRVTEAAYRTTAEDVQLLRDHGWSEPQIAEAVYITALFAFFNRVADAFGIAPQGYLEMNAMTKWAFTGDDQEEHKTLVGWHIRGTVLSLAGLRRLYRLGHAPAAGSLRACHGKNADACLLSLPVRDHVDSGA
jgi:alkylhydroperoxidase family enzyme